MSGENGFPAIGEIGQESDSDKYVSEYLSQFPENWISNSQFRDESIFENSEFQRAGRGFKLKAFFYILTAIFVNLLFHEWTQFADTVVNRENDILGGKSKSK